jgi:prepilin signal peptidase PulO-like enzyme (type II secretory pathway)
MVVVLLCALSMVALSAARVDLRERRLPNSHNLALGGLSVAIAIATSDSFHDLESALLVWLVLASAHLAVGLIPSRPLGMGDIKFIAAVSPPIILWQHTLEWLVLAYGLAALGGLSTRKVSWEARIPFGPYLVAATLLVLVGESPCVALAYCR